MDKKMIYLLILKKMDGKLKKIVQKIEKKLL